MMIVTVIVNFAASHFDVDTMLASDRHFESGRALFENGALQGLRAFCGIFKSQ